MCARQPSKMLVCVSCLLTFSIWHIKNDYREHGALFFCSSIYEAVVMNIQQVMWLQQQRESRGKKKRK